VIAIDPGSQKCGLAVVSGPDVTFPRLRRVVQTERLVAEVSDAMLRFPEARVIVVGGGTGSAALRRSLRTAFPEYELVTIPEHRSSERGRKLFLEENPAPGWRKYLPRTFRTPERPYDDYVAQLLAEDYFQAKSGKTS
jgi:hypothetical protein